MEEDDKEAVGRFSPGGAKTSCCYTQTLSFRPSGNSDERPSQNSSNASLSFDLFFCSVFVFVCARPPATAVYNSLNIRVAGLREHLGEIRQERGHSSKQTRPLPRLVVYFGQHNNRSRLDQAR